MKKEMDPAYVKVKCPYCGYLMPVTYEETAVCEGVFVRCKGRECRRVFEIKIAEGKQK